MPSPGPNGPVDAYWQVDVLSTQWTGPQPAAGALTWRSFPPVDPDHAWLSSLPNPSGLATDQPLDLLVGRLLGWGLVEAPDWPWSGLLPNGTASPCGVEATREAVDVWQDRFDARIFEVAQETGLSARLLKRLFAQETQFWPAGFPDIAEYGLGSLHPEGGDALLLWNISFYQQFCPQVLSEETCTSPYHELIEEDQALLLGALAAQADVTCPTCPGGVNIEAAEQSVDLFAQLLLANCAQTGELVYQASRHVPG